MHRTLTRGWIRGLLCSFYDFFETNAIAFLTAGGDSWAESPSSGDVCSKLHRPGIAGMQHSKRTKQGLHIQSPHLTGREPPAQQGQRAL